MNYKAIREKLYSITVILFLSISGFGQQTDQVKKDSSWLNGAVPNSSGFFYFHPELWEVSDTYQLRSFEASRPEMSGTLEAFINGTGDLVIEEVLGNINDDLMIGFDGTNFNIRLTGGGTINSPGLAADDSNYLSVPAEKITGGDIIFKGGRGNDKLTIDLGDGTNPFTRSITFEGGFQRGEPGDTLALIGTGTRELMEFNYVNAHDGSIDITGNQTITYKGLEPITSTVDATTVTLNYSTSNETITVTDAGGGQTTVNSTAGEITTFDNPTGTLTINAGGTGDDIIDINSLPSNYPADVIIDGQGGNDTLNVNGAVTLGASEGFTATAETINVGASVNANVATLSGDEISITAAVSSSTIFTLEPNTANLPIDLGSVVDNPGILDVSDAEIDFVTANILRIGSSNSGDLTFTANITPANTNTLSLISGDEIIDANTVPVSADIVVSNLALQAVNGIADSTGNVIIETDVDTIAASNATTGGISLVEIGFGTSVTGGDLTVGTVDGVVGIQNLATSGPQVSTQVETNNGDLTINDNVFMNRGNQLLLVAQHVGNGDRVLTNNAAISSTNRPINIRGNNINLAGGTISAGSGEITVRNELGGQNISIDIGGADGAGTLGLTDAELNTITTTGRLIVGSTGSGNITISSAVSPANVGSFEILSGGTIRDTNTTVPDITAPDVILNGEVTPGASPGILNVTGNTALADNDTFSVEIGGTTPGNSASNHDQINATGSVTIGSNVTLSTSSFGGFVPTNGQSYVIINRTGGTGNFNGLPEGGMISTNFLGSGLTAPISYLGGNGDDVVINAFIPTAASAEVSGRILTPTGRGVPRAIVQMTDQNGGVRITRTNPFGYFRFTDIEVGQTLVFNVLSKSYLFAPRIISLEDSIVDLNFIALDRNNLSNGKIKK